MNDECIRTLQAGTKEVKGVLSRTWNLKASIFPHQDVKFHASFPLVESSSWLTSFQRPVTIETTSTVLPWARMRVQVLETESCLICVRFPESKEYIHNWSVFFSPSNATAKARHCQMDGAQPSCHVLHQSQGQQLSTFPSRRTHFDSLRAIQLWAGLQKNCSLVTATSRTRTNHKFQLATWQPNIAGCNTDSICLITFMSFLSEICKVHNVRQLDQKS